MGNEQSLQCEAKIPVAAAPRPMSSMTRTKSSRAVGDSLNKNFLPKSFDRSRDHDKAVAPAGSDQSNGGVESPSLWGWYTRLTPPTPDMYHSRPPTKKHHSVASTVSTISEASIDPDLPLTTNRVFQGLQDKKREAPLAFPSVPL